MSDYENAMTAGPNLALARQVNAFRAGRAEASGPTATMASGSPDWEAARKEVAGMNPQARALAAHRAEILTVTGQGLAGRPYEERKQILAHMAPHLSALLGSDIGGFDPTDANLTHAIGEASIFRGMLGESQALSAAPTPAAEAPASPSALPTAE